MQHQNECWTDLRIWELWHQSICQQAEHEKRGLSHGIKAYWEFFLCSLLSIRHPFPDGILRLTLGTMWLTCLRFISYYSTSLLGSYYGPHLPSLVFDYQLINKYFGILTFIDLDKKVSIYIRIILSVMIWSSSIYKQYFRNPSIIYILNELFEKV